MTQQTSHDQLRPIKHLHTASKLYPQAWSQVEIFRGSRGRDGLPNWPEWCFVPMAAWHAIVSEGSIHAMPLALAGDVSKLSAIGTWRYSQGVYRVDPATFEALSDSIVKGNIPCEVLYRLPEWCVYVETPGMTWIEQPIAGFWAHLEWDVNTQRNELRLLLDGDDDLIPVILHIGPWTITEATDRAIAEADKQARKAGIAPPSQGATSLVEALSGAIQPMVSILLYLCSEEPEIDSDREPGSFPSYPRPSKTKKGLRLFPPKKATIWNVGQSLGKQLRDAKEGEGEYSGRRQSTHLRRGHWHGYWLGPRTGERTFVYRWLSPLVIKGKPDGETLS